MNGRITLEVTDLNQVLSVAEANGWTVTSVREDGAKAKKPATSLTVSEAAAKLNAHPDTIRRWAAEGKIASFRTPGGHRRIPVEAIIERQNGQATPVAEVAL